MAGRSEIVSERKPWGSTELLFFNGVTQVNRILVLPRGYSSRHFHTQKINVFVVLRGALEVCTYPMHIWNVHTTRQVLYPGSSCTIWPCVVHRFFALEATEAIETYYAICGGEVRLDDITRFDANGVAADDHDPIDAR